MAPAKKALKLFWFFFLPFFLVLVVYPPRISGFLSAMDEGPWLSAAQTLINGKTLYRDVFFQQGLLLAAWLKLMIMILPATLSSVRASFWLLNALALLWIYAV